MPEPARSREARDLAERALIRLVQEYGAVPEFVLLGGLIPDLLCSTASSTHIGTTDVDVQVNLEITNGSVNARRLESALGRAGFQADSERAWRWHDRSAPGLIVKAEFLADLEDVPNQTTLSFDGCEKLGAINLRGTAFATLDWQLHQLTATGTGGRGETVELRISGLGGYLLAKTHAAHRRRATKDWYDLAYVLIHNNAGGPRPAASAVLQRFAAHLTGETRTALEDLDANFAVEDAQGPTAYAETMLNLHPDRDWDLLANDAVTAVDMFVSALHMR